MSPLANNEDGYPFEVPIEATGWLIKRHGGGKGRPTLIYGRDGRPLVVPMSATVEDLRANGCEAGLYRLEGVDAERKPVTACSVAYVQVVTDDDESTPATPATTRDDRNDALARSIEALVRPYIERERHLAEQMRAQAETMTRQTELHLKLIEKLAMPKQPEGIKEALGELAEVQKFARRNSGESTVTPKTTPAAPSKRKNADEWQEELVKRAFGMIEGLTPIAQQWLWTKIATMKGKKEAPPKPEARNAAPPEEPQPPKAEQSAFQAEDGDGGDEGEEVDAEIGHRRIPTEVARALAEIYERLTDEEQNRMHQLLAQASPFMLNQAYSMMLGVTPDMAVSWLRKTYLQPNGNGTRRWGSGGIGVKTNGESATASVPRSKW